MSEHSLAIIGIGCRLPGADSPAAYWRLLAESRVMFGEAPAGRRRLRDQVFGRAESRQDPWIGAFIEDVFAFDCDYFAIAPREAAVLDPQQRLIIQAAAWAIEDAGIDRRLLADKVTGVFTGVSAHDFSILTWAAEGGQYAATGTANGLTANRLSYWLNASGPSLAVDTACSSAITALHTARLSLLSGECDFALCAASSVMLLPEVSAALQTAGIVSHSGRCRPFDAGGDGYVRGEGAGAVLMCRLQDAVAGRYRIYAEIKGSAINHNGLSNGLTAPRPEAQMQVIRQAYAAAGTEPAACRYIEAMAAAQPLADSMELKALNQTIGLARSDSPCFLGALKGNIGHLEAASGMAGLIKLALMLKHGEMLPLTGLQHPVDYLQRDNVNLIPVRRREALPCTDGEVVSLNALGFGGANAHVVLAPPPAMGPAHSTAGIKPIKKVAGTVTQPLRLLTLSAHSRPVLRSLVRIYSQFVAECPVPLPDIGYTSNMSRCEWPWRVAVSGDETADMVARLDALASAQQCGVKAPARPPGVALVFGDCTAGRLPGLERAASQWAGFADDMQAVIQDLPDAAPDGLQQCLLKGVEETAPWSQRAWYGLIAPLVYARAWNRYLPAGLGVSAAGTGIYAASVHCGLFSLNNAWRLLQCHAQKSSRKNCEQYLAIVERAIDGQLRDQYPQRQHGPSELLEPDFWRALATRDLASLRSIKLSAPGDFGCLLDLPGREDLAVYLTHLYEQDVALDWEAIHGQSSTVRTSLPGYPFTAGVDVSDAEALLAPKGGAGADEALLRRLQAVLEQHGF